MKTLFDIPSKSHRADPVSSFEAADFVGSTGKGSSQRLAVLAALKSHPRVTSAELADIMAISRYVVARRLPELADQGLIKRSDKNDVRKCRICGRNCVTWWAVLKTPLFGE